MDHRARARSTARSRVDCRAGDSGRGAGPSPPRAPAGRLSARRRADRSARRTARAGRRRRLHARRGRCGAPVVRGRPRAVALAGVAVGGHGTGRGRGAGAGHLGAGGRGRCGVRASGRAVAVLWRAGGAVLDGHREQGLRRSRGAGHAACTRCDRGAAVPGPGGGPVDAAAARVRRRGGRGRRGLAAARGGPGRDDGARERRPARRALDARPDRRDTGP